MKLGSVPYLNALPLTAGAPYPIQRVIPRQLRRLLSDGTVDLALLSTVTLFENADFYIVPGMGISSKGPVQSVKLFFNKQGLTIGDIKNFKQSSESNTANMLAQVLLARPPLIALNGIASVPAGPCNDTHAEVVIGDAAMIRPDPYGSVDLGKLWTERTGLPFVFAAWISRHRQIPRSLWNELIATKARNLGALDRCITESPLLPEFSLEAKRSYLRDNIHYELGDIEMAGLQKFREECIRSALLPNAHPIQFAEIV